MNNMEYLEYEGSRLLDYALGTFSKGSSGDLTNDMERVLLAEHPDLSLEKQEQLQDFFWEYVLFRLYITDCRIRNFQDCFGSRTPILTGLDSMLHSIPSHLKMLSLEKDLAGSYLIVGRHASAFHYDYVTTQFKKFRTIESNYAKLENKKEARRLSIEASLKYMADSIGFTLSPAFIAFLQKETLAYMTALSERLTRITPEGVHERAHKKTLLHTHSSIFTQETYDHLYPSFTLLASMAAGLLFMFA